MPRFVSIVFILTLIFATAPIATADQYTSIESELNWIEIEDIGRPIEQLRDNSYHGPFPIGFQFTFYGQMYEEYWISANGFIGFGPPDEYSTAFNEQQPYHFPPDNIVAIYWKDLDPEAFWNRNSIIYRANRNGNCVIQYQDYSELNDDGVTPDNIITMQIVLEPDGDIILQYAEIGDDFNLATGSIGIENRDGSEGLSLRYDGEGVEIAGGTAFRITPNPPGNFLVWDAGTETESGTAQAAAMEALEHNVTHLSLADNEQLPNNLADYEAVFVNLGNIGAGGNHYHELTAAEGVRLANYLDNGGAVYMEGANTWTVDRVTEAHSYFMIEGVGNGAPLEPPVTGIEGTFMDGLMFDDYQADHNNSVDHLAPIENAQSLFTHNDQNGVFVGMVSFLGQSYRTVGSSFEFGGLVDGNSGTKRELMLRMIRFFRTPPPEFLPPTNLLAVPGDHEVMLMWDFPPHEGRDLQQVIELQHEIARLTSADQKPNGNDRDRIVELKQSLVELRHDLYAQPRRDELHGFNIYLDGERYDFTNGRRYTVIELENDQAYTFSVSTVYVDPDGESDLADPVTAVPSEVLTLPYAIDFEEARGSFVGLPANGWEWGEPELGAASGTHAWSTKLNEPYEDLATYILYTPIIDLTDQELAWFNFNHYMDCEGGWDGGRVEISLGEDRWTVITPRNGYSEETVFAFNDHPAFSGRTQGWEPVSYNLDEYLDQQIRLRFVFKSDDSNFRPYAGWMIDDVSLSGSDVGNLRVTVSDEIEDLTVSDVEITLGNGEYRSITDRFGQAFFMDIPAGVWELSTNKLGYIPRQIEVNIVDGEDLEIDVFIEQWNSDLSVNPDQFAIDVEAGNEHSETITITNNGEHGTEFQIYIAYGNDNEERQNIRQDNDDAPRRDEPWDLVQTFNLSESTDEQFFIGAEFVKYLRPKDYRLVVGAGDFTSGDCYFYQFGRNGNYIGRVPQRNYKLTGWGLRDLAYDGENVIGAVDDSLFFMDPINGDYNDNLHDIEFLDINRAVAYVPGDSAYWVGNGSSSWFKIHYSGMLIDRVTDHGLTGVVGMAWNPSDPDGDFLYIHNQESVDGGAAIYSYNPETGELSRRLETAAEEEGNAGGLFVTHLYDTHNYHVGALIQQHGGDDVIKLYELWDYNGWLSVSPTSGELDGDGASTEIEVTFDATNLISSENYAEIEIHDQLTGVVTTVTCDLFVEGGFASLDIAVVFDDDANLWEDVVATLFDEYNDFVAFGFSDNEGHILFNNIPPDEYWFELDPIEGYHNYSSEMFALVSDETLELDVVLEHFRLGGGDDFPALRGQVTSIYNEALEPLAGVEISAVREGDNDRGEQRFFTAETDEEGVYVFDDRLPEATYIVSARLAGWRGDLQEAVEIREGEEVEINFVMSDLLAVQSLRTTGYYDDKIRLDWLPPGTVGDEITLRYSDDNLANGVYLANREDILSTRFEPEGQYDLLAISIYMFDNADLGRNNWPDRYDDAFVVKIFNEDPETNLPGELIIQEDVRSGHRHHWVDIEFDAEDSRFLEGPFYVGWNLDPGVSQSRHEANGLDENFDHEGTVFIRFDSIWEEYNGLPGDPMISALIWSYFEDQPVELNFAGNIESRHTSQTDDESLEDRITLLNPNCPSVRLYEQPFHEIDRRLNHPRRDPFVQYQLFIDGELVEDSLSDPSWIHVVGSENEDTEYSYMVATMYEGEEDPIVIDGVEEVGRANMPPRAVLGPSIQVNGFSYTISWEPPTRNADFFSNCIDYAGCDIYLNGELIHFEPSDEELEEYSWSSAIEDGEEGWYTFRLVARDEVPNFSQPVEITAPIGEAVIHDFEVGDRPIFLAEPFNEIGWQLSSLLNGGPEDAHSGRDAWGTRPNEEEYENNATWTLTSHLYSVTNESSQLDFYHFMSSEFGNDGGQLLISVNDGDWTVIEPINGYDDDRIDGLLNTPGFSGSTDGWELVSFDLSDYINQIIQLKWKFATDHTIYRYGGWYIDDVVLWGCDLADLGEVAGTVTDQNGEAVNDAIVTDGRMSTATDENGAYRLTDIYPGQVTLTTSKVGYRTESVEIQFDAGDSLEHNFEQYHAQLYVDEEEFAVELRENEQLEDLLEIHNDGDEGEVTPWTIRIERDELPGRDDPWDIVFDYPLSEQSEHSRYQGAEFANGIFYLPVADPIIGNTIDRFDWDGDYLGNMRLPFDSIGWGLRDLAWDGEFLYGSQNDSIYAFSPEGRPSTVQPGAPIDLNRALAYDDENDGFWAAEWDSPWYLLDRNGEVQFSWNGHNLTGVYGFAYHPDEPDGMPLYTFNREEDGSTGIYRSDPNAGNIELVHEMEGSPAGCFITDSWDHNTWVIGGIVDDRLPGFELGRGSGWITVSPTSGEIQPGDSEDIVIQIDMPEDAEGMLEATIVIYAFGAIQHEVAVTVSVMDGFRHFPSPIESDDFNEIGIESATWFGNPLPDGSEIALLTPRGEVGGAGRWFGNEFNFKMYKGDGAFQRYERPTFVVWNSETDEFHEPLSSFTSEQTETTNDSTQTLVFSLDVIVPVSQTIQLSRGWNQISSSIQPLSPFVEKVCESIGGNVTLLKGEAGRFWVPSHHFNGIPYWNGHQGYQIRLDEPSELTVIGKRMLPTTVIKLNEGWNLISYLPDSPFHPATALSSIWNETQILKDGSGHFIIPEWDYLGFTQMEPGQGYHIRLSEPAELVYADNNGVANESICNPVYGADTPPTGSDMSLLITALDNVNSVAGSNLLVLAGEQKRAVVDFVFPQLDGLHFPCGVVIRGNDTMTNDINGALDDELLTIVLRNSQGEYQPLNVELKAGELKYSNNSYAVVELEQIDILPDRFVLDEVYPNPFNGRTNVRFSVPEPTDVKVAVWSIQGRQVLSSPLRQYQAGWHSLDIDASVWPSGMYILELSTPNTRTVKKMVLMR